MARKKITVHKEGYHRKAYTRSDGTHVKAADVGPTSFKIVDRGARGRTPKSKRFFHPKSHTGWEKNQSATVRRNHLIDSCEAKTYKRKGYTYIRNHKKVTVKPAKIHSDIYLCAARKAQYLANVTTDKSTERLSRLDARVLFKKAKTVG